MQIHDSYVSSDMNGTKEMEIQTNILQNNILKKFRYFCD